MRIETTPKPKPRVRRDDAALLWAVDYPCCATRTMRFHEWSLAYRIAAGHVCPKPPEAPAFARPRRLTPTIR